MGSDNWKKPQLMKKLKSLLNEKRESLLSKLEISPQSQNKEKMSAKNVKVENSILLFGKGDDLYLTADGYFLHAPKETEKTLFIVDQTVNGFVFKGKSYDL